MFFRRSWICAGSSRLSFSSSTVQSHNCYISPQHNILNILYSLEVRKQTKIRLSQFVTMGSHTLPTEMRTLETAPTTKPLHETIVGSNEGEYSDTEGEAGSILKFIQTHSDKTRKIETLNLVTINAALWMARRPFSLNDNVMNQNGLEFLDDGVVPPHLGEILNRTFEDHAMSRATKRTRAFESPTRRRSPLIEVVIDADQYGHRKETVIAGWAHCDDALTIDTDVSCEDSECDYGCQCFRPQHYLSNHPLRALPFEISIPSFNKDRDDDDVVNDGDMIETESETSYGNSEESCEELVNILPCPRRRWHTKPCVGIQELAGWDALISRGCQLLK